MRCCRYFRKCNWADSALRQQTEQSYPASLRCGSLPLFWTSPDPHESSGFAVSPLQIKFLLLVSRQGKVRLSKWYEMYSAKDKARITREVSALVLSRAAKMCNIVEYKEHKIVYKRCVAAERTALRV